MSDITPVRRNIQVEESRFRFAVSESGIQKMGASVNFINNYQHSEKQFFANGLYAIVTPPQLGVDGLTIFEFNAFIINVWAFNLVAGTSGTTELDIKRATSPGGAFSSIFSTTPKFTSAAAANSYVGVGDVLAGSTAPVLSLTNVDAGDALKFDILQSMPGAQNAGLLIHYRPR